MKWLSPTLSKFFNGVKTKLETFYPKHNKRVTGIRGGLALRGTLCFATWWLTNYWWTGQWNFMWWNWV